MDLVPLPGGDHGSVHGPRPSVQWGNCGDSVVLTGWFLPTKLHCTSTLLRVERDSACAYDGRNIYFT